LELRLNQVTGAQGPQENCDRSALASSLQNNGEQCVTAIWNVFGGNDMIATCGMSGSATMDLSNLVNDKWSPKYDTGAQGLRKTVTEEVLGIRGQSRDAYALL
jgi:hypothetical protein